MFGSFNEFIKHFPIHFCRLFLSQLKEYLPRLDIFLKKIGHFHYKKERISHVFHCYVIGAKTIIILFLNGKIWFRNRYYLGSLKNNIWCEIIPLAFKNWAAHLHLLRKGVEQSSDNHILSFCDTCKQRHVCLPGFTVLQRLT